MKFQAQFVCTVTIILFCATAIDSTPKQKTTEATNKHGGQTTTETSPKTTSHTILTSHNDTSPLFNGTIHDSWYGKNRGMLNRTFYVVIGITAIVVVYFGVRAFRYG